MSVATVGLAGRALRSATGLLFPPHCPACDQRPEGGESGLCRECRASLMAIAEPFCKVCGEPFEGVISSEFRCGNCAYRKFHFEFAIAGYRSIGAARKLIHAFKYSKRVALRRELGGLLLRGFEDPRIDVSGGILVPVPLHPRKQRERGFNQAEEVAHVAAKELGIPVVNALRRLRYTDTQVHMHRNQRLHNMRGAVTLAKSKKKYDQLKGATVFLIDDVLTTGATAQECARVLKKEAGAEKVIVVTICRAAGYSKPKL
ncbi:MAG: competence protein ComFC [Verrucomicrobiales bacterium]|jgi:competence protein ComFC